MKKARQQKYKKKLSQENKLLSLHTLEQESASDLVSNLNESSNSSTPSLNDENYEINVECDKSTSESETVIISNEVEIRQLQEWIVNYNISQNAADDLLKIFKNRLLPTIPLSAKTLLKCDIV